MSAALSSTKRMCARSLLMRRCSFDSRKREVEGGSLIDLRFDPDASPIAVDNALADRQTNASSGNVLSVQPLEDAENLLVIFRVDTEAVVRHRKAPEAVSPFRRYMNPRRASAAILERVADEVLKELDEMGLITGYRGQAIAGDDRLVFLDPDFAVFEGLLENPVEIDRLNSFLVTSQLRVGQQVGEQFPHALRAFGDEFDARRGFAVELAAIAIHQELRIAGDHPQRLLQIVAGRKSELIQVFIGAKQRRV